MARLFSMVCQSGSAIDNHSAQVMTMLRDAVRQAAHSPGRPKALAQLQIEASHLDGPEFEKLWSENARRVGDVVRLIRKIN